MMRDQDSQSNSSKDADMNLEVLKAISDPSTTKDFIIQSKNLPEDLAKRR